MASALDLEKCIKSEYYMILKAHCKGCLGGSQNLDLECWFDYKALPKSRGALTIVATSWDVRGSTVHAACCVLVPDQEVMSFVYCVVPAYQMRRAT